MSLRYKIFFYSRQYRNNRHILFKIIRDQAYTHLKEAVDEIRGAGKYVFRQDKEHSLEYTSQYMRLLKSKQKRKSKKTKKKATK